MIDIRALKSRVDLREVASRYTVLKQASVTEQSGPCPKCGGRDRFHCTAQWFFCRQCHASRGDVIEFMQWVEGCDFRAALDHLGGAVQMDAPNAQRQPAPLPKASRLYPPRDYRPLAVHAIRMLAGDQGASGRAYLMGRGLRPATWQAWGLGLHRCQRRGTGKRWIDLGWGVTLPWVMDGKVTGINCRLLTHAQRYHRLGQVAGLFGEHKLAGRETLICCEGELNALSIWQALNGAVDVLSFGAEWGVKSPRFRAIAGAYAQVMVWCDRAAVVESVLLKLESAQGLKSPRGLDANDLLRAGLLADFLARCLATRPARAESESSSSMPALDAARQRLDHLLNLGIAASPAEIEEAIRLGHLLGIKVVRRRTDLNNRA
jgi:hypothetical protein